MQVFLALLMQEWSYEDYVGQRNFARVYETVSCKIKVNTCTICEIGLSTQEEDADLPTHPHLAVSPAFYCHHLPTPLCKPCPNVNVNIEGCRASLGVKLTTRLSMKHERVKRIIPFFYIILQYKA